MIQRYIINKPSATVTVDGAAEGQAIAVQWCKSEDVAELETKYDMLDKHCFSLFHAVCDLTSPSIKESRHDIMKRANEAAMQYICDPVFWLPSETNDIEGDES